MIARHDATTAPDKSNLWAALAAPLDAAAIAWRQQGAPHARDGGWYARFAPQPGPNAVRERLDRVVPGEWDLTLELLPALPVAGGQPVECAFKARLQILGVIREDVGVGADYKAAANDALARAAVRFGIGHELADTEPNWVAVDGPEPAIPVEAPAAAHERRAAASPARSTARRGDREASRAAATSEEYAPSEASSANVAPTTPVESGYASGDEDPICPKCSGRMWDNRLTKRNPKAPDYKCRDRSCDGVVWPARPGEPVEGSPPAQPSRPAGRANGRARPARHDDEPGFDPAPLGASGRSPIDDDDLPF